MHCLFVEKQEKTVLVVAMFIIACLIFVFLPEGKKEAGNSRQ